MWPKKFKMHSPKQHSNLDYKLKPGQMVKCHLCSFISSDSVVLKDHFLTHAEDRKFFSCSICKKRFNQKIHLKAHQRTHSSEKPYICPICHKEFSDACYSHNQRQFNAKVKPFACSVCGKFFAQNCDKLKHELTHHHQSKENLHSEQNEPNSEKPELNSEQTETHSEQTELNEPKFHKCSKCIQSFPEESQLKLHIVRIHANDPSDKCPVCTRGFTTPRALKIHVKKIHPETVSSDRNNKCHICSYSSIHLTTFRRHLLTHTGEKPHTCHICQKKFTQKVNLTTHLRIHYLDKPFVCPICDKAFTQSSHLQKHHKSVHSNSRRALFSVKKTFSYNRLKLKIRSTAKKRHKCPHCNQRFIQASELKVHKQKKHLTMKVQIHGNAEQSTDTHQKLKRTIDSDTNSQKTYNKKLNEEKQNKSTGTYQKSKKTNETDTNIHKSSNKFSEEKKNKTIEDNSDTKQKKRKNPERSAVIDKINKKQFAINRVQQIRDIRAEIEAITQIGYKKESDPVSKTVSQQILEINAEIAAITQNKLIKNAQSKANLPKKQVKITSKNGKVKEKQKKHLGDKYGVHEKSKKLLKITKNSIDTKKNNKQPVSNAGLKRRCKKPPERNDVILKKYKELFGSDGAIQHSHENYLEIGINGKQQSNTNCKSIADIEKQQQKQVIVIADIHHIEPNLTSQKPETNVYALNSENYLTLANTDITAVDTLNNEATLKAGYVEPHESITHHKDNDTHQSESDLNTQQSESGTGTKQSESDTGTQQSESDTVTKSDPVTQQAVRDTGTKQSECHTGTKQSESDTGTQQSESDPGTQQAERNIGTQQSVNIENSNVGCAKSIADTCLLENNGNLKISEKNSDSADPECGRNGKTHQGQSKHPGNDTEYQVRGTELAIDSALCEEKQIEEAFKYENIHDDLSCKDITVIGKDVTLKSVIDLTDGDKETPLSPLRHSQNVKDNEKTELLDSDGERPDSALDGSVCSIAESEGSSLEILTKEDCEPSSELKIHSQEVVLDNLESGVASVRTPDITLFDEVSECSTTRSNGGEGGCVEEKNISFEGLLAKINLEQRNDSTSVNCFEELHGLISEDKFPEDETLEINTEEIVKTLGNADDNSQIFSTSIEISAPTPNKVHDSNFESNILQCKSASISNNSLDGTTLRGDDVVPAKTSDSVPIDVGPEGFFGFELPQTSEEHPNDKTYRTDDDDDDDQSYILVKSLTTSEVEARRTSDIQDSNSEDDILRSMTVRCTSCDRKLSPQSKQIRRHVRLKVLVCQDCHDLCSARELFSNAITEKYCQWCGNYDEKQYDCHFCPSSFCHHCLRRNFNDYEIKIVTGEDWKCYNCDPSKLADKVAYCNLLMEAHELSSQTEEPQQVLPLIEPPITTNSTRLSSSDSSSTSSSSDSDSTSESDIDETAVKKSNTNIKGVNLGLSPVKNVFIKQEIEETSINPNDLLRVVESTLVFSDSDQDSSSSRNHTGARRKKMRGRPPNLIRSQPTRNMGYKVKNQVASRFSLVDQGGVSEDKCEFVKIQVKKEDSVSEDRLGGALSKSAGVSCSPNAVASNKKVETTSLNSDSNAATSSEVPSHLLNQKIRRNLRSRTIEIEKIENSSTKRRLQTVNMEQFLNDPKLKVQPYVLLEKLVLPICKAPCTCNSINAIALSNDGLDESGSRLGNTHNSCSHHPQGQKATSEEKIKPRGRPTRQSKKAARTYADKRLQSCMKIVTKSHLLKQRRRIQAKKLIPSSSCSAVAPKVPKGSTRSQASNDAPPALQKQSCNTRPGIAQFPCSICKKTFRSVSARRGHERLHSDPKMLKCPLCEQRFNNLQFMKDHITRVHTLFFPHKCSFCGKGFMRPGALKIHMQKQHGVLFA